MDKITCAPYMPCQEHDVRKLSAPIEIPRSSINCPTKKGECLDQMQTDHAISVNESLFYQIRLPGNLATLTYGENYACLSRKV